MRRQIPTLAVLLSLCLSPAFAQIPRETPREETEREEPGFPEAKRLERSPEELERKALDAMTSGRYKKAGRLFEELLDLRGNEPSVLFNLACALSRSGELEEAARRLEQAWQAGLRDPRLLRDDPDLESLRESSEGKALVERLVAEEEARLRLQGVPQFFEAPTLGGFRVVAPEVLEAERSYPLVVVLHGHGGSAEFYAGMFEASGIAMDAIVMAPYGPYPVALERGHGYSWYPPIWLYRQVLATENSAMERGEVERLESDVSRRYVMAAIEAVSRSYPVDPEHVFVIGHSEGGALAYDLALDRPDLFRGLIVVAGRFRESEAREKKLVAAAEHLKALICHSPQDQAIGIEYAERAREAFREAGVKSQLIRYPGGHGMTNDFLRQIAKWLGKTSRDSRGE